MPPSAPALRKLRPRRRPGFAVLLRATCRGGVSFLFPAAFLLLRRPETQGFGNSVRRRRTPCFSEWVLPCAAAQTRATPDQLLHASCSGLPLSLPLCPA